MDRFEPCPVCSQVVVIREDGTVSSHFNPVEAGSVANELNYCPGSNKAYLIVPEVVVHEHFVP